MKTMRRILCSLVLVSLLLSIFALPAATAETTVTLGKKLTYSKGQTTISWSVKGDELSSYWVWVELVNDKAEAEQTIWRVGETKKHSFKTPLCVPGRTYRVYITDSNRRILTDKKYTLDKAETFKDGKLKNTSVKITIEPRKMKTGGNPKKDAKKISALKASDIVAGLKNGKTSYGIKYHMKMPQLAKERSFFVTLVFEAPNGYLDVDKAGDLKFDRVLNGYQTLWFDITGYDFFENLYQENGEIPTGTYKVHLYWDGMWVNTSTFKVQ